MATGTKKYILWRFCLCSLLIGTLSILTLGVNASEEEIPSELQCRPYIEKALKDLEAGEVHLESKADSQETSEQTDISQEDSKEAVDNASVEESNVAQDESQTETEESNSVELADEPYVEEMIIESDSQINADDSNESNSQEEAQTEKSSDDDSASNENNEEADASAEQGDSQETSAEETTPEDENGITSSEVEAAADDSQSEESTEAENAEEVTDDADSKEENASNEADSKEEEEGKNSSEESEEAAAAEDASNESAESQEQADSPAVDDSKEDDADSKEQEQDESKEDSKEEASIPDANSAETDDSVSAEDSAEKKDESAEGQESAEQKDESGESKESGEAKDESDEAKDESGESKEESGENKDESGESKEEEQMQMDEAPVDDAEAASQESVEENIVEDTASEVESAQSAEQEEVASETEAETEEVIAETETAPQEPEETPEDDLLMEIVIPDNLRAKDHIGQILRLDAESTESELLVDKSADIMLRELKRLYDTAIKPLEILYKYRDLSNRHYGDPEIFSKPLVLFMGPWSGGKSSLINYLTDNEFTEWSLRTGAEPSPAYFNILMYGNEPEVLDGTQLAADWTFSGLQKFGQGLEERLRGLKLPNKLLERVNIVEIPGILEVRKQVSRVFPFNDACQWFIDRADIIFLVYDPSKLDVGPETEAILDQLKGRESQTRIILNKADQVKPEELMRVQSALIWNISPLMSSAQPPVMYTTSLWSMPYESGSPARLLQSQEKAFLRDLRGAIDKRIENKISSARRFAVRVRNHAKMVDCYLTTYYNHKTIFGNKKVVAEAIIEHPQNYHIYEGLSTLTNISRYDLPDPETYRDFFRLNPLYEFQQLSATCTYFRGCPINRLDVAIAYDLPELVGKYKKMVETVTPQGMPKS